MLMEQKNNGERKKHRPKDISRRIEKRRGMNENIKQDTGIEEIKDEDDHP